MEILEKIFGNNGLVNYLSIAISVLGIFYLLFVVSKLAKIKSVPGSTQIFLSVTGYFIVITISFTGQLLGSPIIRALSESAGEFVLSLLFISATFGFNKFINYVSAKS